MATLPHVAQASHEAASDGHALIVRTRSAQRLWAAEPMRTRLRMLRCFRDELATGARELAATIAAEAPGSLRRGEADTLVAEVLPLAEACRFLEREAAFTLRTQRESSRSRPFWLRSVDVEVERVALGVVLLIAPSNYPLFLAGAQALQALAAGNAVLWKPAPTGIACAHAVRVMLIASGMPPDLMVVLDSSVVAATSAIETGVDKVFLTGSSATGESVLHALAATATPSVMELSGCDAVFVLPGADLPRVVDALTFGLRFNASATCMAPRRIFVAQTLADPLCNMLADSLEKLPPVPVPRQTAERLRSMLSEAVRGGAEVVLHGVDSSTEYDSVCATLVLGAKPSMSIAQSDIFAPVLSILPYQTLEQAAAMHEQCPYALTAAIFGPVKQAAALQRTITAGTVVLNDLIVSTADPRVPFSGRRRSGFGATRGREGLLAMTAPRAVVRQRSRSRVPYQPTGAAHGALFAGYLQAVHAQNWRTRLAGLRAMGKALPALRPAAQKASAGKPSGSSRAPRIRAPQKQGK